MASAPTTGVALSKVLLPRSQPHWLLRLLSEDAPAIGDTWKSWEREVIIRTLLLYNGNTKRTAMALDISIRKVQERIKRWKAEAQVLT